MYIYINYIHMIIYYIHIYIYIYIIHTYIFETRAKSRAGRRRVAATKTRSRDESREGKARAGWGGIESKQLWQESFVEITVERVALSSA